ncbi:hypothetical protein [Bradyrhizobium sp. Tv2a-2]|uniref:hypothetical protein n=1 Tax=Bradyrhizobium sp. Tv2a-2 TaxID=113395 RepID=UPI0003F601C9|nr:hypothetical protein [Bradyrhizobium sp. Tv2a-2]
MSRRGIKCNVARIGFVVIASGCAVASVPSQGAVRHKRPAAYRHNWSIQPRAALALVAEPTHPGPMRYYGGPKSPIWRQ